jgi:hypothetical protein
MGGGEGAQNFLQMSISYKYQRLPANDTGYLNIFVTNIDGF